jgi:SAM-dependent MidA family methyltransferase
MVPWRDAMERALYGPVGFYRSGAGPAAHFRTNVQASRLFAGALAELIGEVDDLLDHPKVLDVVDVGAADGGLLASILSELPTDLAARVQLVGVEIRNRPAKLPLRIEWRGTLPEHITGVLLANEWLDNVPLDVVERTTSGISSVLVDRLSGDEQLGSAISSGQAEWLDRWWSLTAAEVGDRAEVGNTRDDAWCDAVASIQRGLAVAIDYSHSREARVSGNFATGTLAGFRDGRWTAPVPDGSCDITAHVALDACGAAAESPGVEATLLTTQREALMALGVSGSRPPLEWATADPAKYVAALASASEAGELLDRSGLGGFGWLVQTRRMGLPPSLSSLGDNFDGRPSSR